MIGVNVQVNKNQLQKLQQRLSNVKGGMKKAVSRGINQTAATSRTIIIKTMHDETGIKNTAIKAGLKTTKASQKKWVATHHISGKRVPLAKFGVRASKATGNIAYQISETQGRKRIAYDREDNRVFVKKLKTGHKGVWWIPSGGKKLVQLYGPSIPFVFDKTNKISKAVKRHIREKLWKNINRIAKGLVDGTIKK